MSQLKKILINIIILCTLANSAFAQKTKQIIIIHADVISVNELLMPNIQILKGAVILKHDSALMFCDSAYYNSKEKRFSAFGKIHIKNPTEDLKDTVYLWGDSLNYSGQEKLARVRSHVILKKDSMTLFTDNLDYNISSDIGKYVDGGRTINGEDTLFSRQGYYYANEDLLFFKEKVKIFNPKYNMYCDTLKHNTKKKISYILGPTDIVSRENDSSYIYCENGWYNHKTDIAQFNKNALLVNKKQTLEGDSLYYDRKKKVGRAFNNVTAIDSTQNALLLGDLGEYHEKTQSTMMTQKALFIMIQKGDSMFMHADTLLSLKDTIRTKTDTIGYTLIKGFHKVKLFKSDFQAKCDSLVYSTLDSTIEMHTRPVMWSGKNQITGKFVRIKTKDNKISKVFIETNSLIVSQCDSVDFNQIRGKNMVAYFKDSTLRKIDVKEDGAYIYFVTEKVKVKEKEEEKLVGVNKLTCKNMTIYLNKSEVDTVWFYENPTGTLYPPKYLAEEELKFDIFQWNDKHRPKSKDDVFKWVDDKEIKTLTKKTVGAPVVKDKSKEQKKGATNSDKSKQTKDQINTKTKSNKK